MLLSKVVPALLATLLAACAPTIEVALPSPSPTFVTATLPASGEPTRTELVEIASATPQPTSIGGTTTTQVNVRQEPVASSRVLGTLAATDTVQVVAREPAGNWYEILYDAGEGGRGWVAAQYVRLPDQAVVPLPSGAPFGSVREQINVRSGPGTQFDAVGLLKAQDAVELTGKDRSGFWLRINYVAGPDGKAWVAASFLETTNTDELPVVTDTGEVVGTSTPAATSPGEPTSVPVAPEDGDSLAAPAVDVRFSPRGPGSIIYSGDLSSPEGDSSDWIGFTPYFDSITVGLNCTGDAGLVGEILSQGTVVADVPAIECGSERALTLEAGSMYELHLFISSSAPRTAYARYTVSLFAVPAY